MTDDTLIRIGNDIVKNDGSYYSGELPSQEILANLAIKLLPYAEQNHQITKQSDPSFFLTDKPKIVTSLGLAMDLWTEAGAMLGRQAESNEVSNSILPIIKDLLGPLKIGRQSLPQVELPDSEHIKMKYSLFLKSCCGLSKEVDRVRWFRAYRAGDSPPMGQAALDRFGEWAKEAQTKGVSDPIRHIVDYRWWRLGRGKQPDQEAAAGTNRLDLLARSKNR